MSFRFSQWRSMAHASSVRQLREAALRASESHASLLSTTSFRIAALESEAAATAEQARQERLAAEAEASAAAEQSRLQLLTLEEKAAAAEAAVRAARHESAVERAALAEQAEAAVRAVREQASLDRGSLEQQAEAAILAAKHEAQELRRR